MEKVGFGGFVALVVLMVIGVFGVSVASAMHTETKTCTVESKDRTSKSDGSSDARIYTEDCGVLSVNDTVLRGKFNSADRYAAIKAGETYKFELQGFRIEFFSMFPNVLSSTKVG